MSRTSVVLRGAFLGSPFYRGPPCRGQYGRDRKHGEQCEQRMNGDEQRDRHSESEDPPAGREDRHVQMVENEHLIAQHGQAIQVVGTLVMRDRGNGGLKPRDVRFQSDLDLISKPSLHADAHGAQEPRRRGRYTESYGGYDGQAPVSVEHSFAE